VSLLRRAPKYVLTVALGTLAAATAVAGPEGYLGGSIGRASLSTKPQDLGIDFDIEGNTTGYKLFAGVRFLKFLSVEGSLFDLGKIEDSVLGFDFRGEVRGLDAFLGATLRAGKRVELFAKAGYSYWELDAEVSDGDQVLPRDEDGTGFAFGLGLAIQLHRRVAIRAEWEAFDLESVDDVSFASIGLEVRF
jgi:opacity protein-like surface antigen